MLTNNLLPYICVYKTHFFKAKLGGASYMRIRFKYLFDKKNFFYQFFF